MPPIPVSVSVYVVDVLRVVFWLPLVATVPKVGLIEALVALMLDHMSCDVPFGDMLVGLAVKVPVGGGTIVTVACAAEVFEPPGPVSARVYVVVDDGETLSVPEVASDVPLMVALVAFEVDQDSVEVPPAAIDAGLADMLPDGGGLTTTVACSVAVPVGPVNVSV